MSLTSLATSASNPVCAELFRRHEVGVVGEARDVVEEERGDDVITVLVTSGLEVSRDFVVEVLFLGQSRPDVPAGQALEHGHEVVLILSAELGNRSRKTTELEYAGSKRPAVPERVEQACTCFQGHLDAFVVERGAGGEVIEDLQPLFLTLETARAEDVSVVGDRVRRTEVVEVAGLSV